MSDQISTKLIEKWTRDYAISDIEEVFSEMGVNIDDYLFINEFYNLQDLISWWIARDERINNVPEWLVKCLDADAIMREVAKEFITITLERRNNKKFYFVFREKPTLKIFEDRND